MGKQTRTETDFIGTVEVPGAALFGINSLRAAENFALNQRRMPFEMIKALAMIKKCAARAHVKLDEIESDKANLIVAACDEIIQGLHSDQFIVNPLQGGAGTSANMNINEVVANRANQLGGFAPGAYDNVHPLDHVNKGQSTNDVFPSALKIAAIWKLREMVEEVARLQEALQAKENEFAGIIKIGRTQLRDAVPLTLGAEFGAYAEALSRDRWRLYRVEERLRVINLGATAIGTGIAATRKFHFEMIKQLREETGIGLARADNLVEATQNADVFSEISGLMKPLAVNLNKMASDLRLLASGPRSGIGEIILPPVQEGSTVMPGKVNPVMCEMLNQVCMKVMGNDQIISHAASSGQLELNAFLPLIMDVLLESLELLKNGMSLFNSRCLKGIKANEQRCLDNLRGSLGLLTILTGKIGHDRASMVYRRHLEKGEPVDKILIEEGLATSEEISQAIKNYRFD
ncbi:MAG: aspartate ammonia-lyase [Candidatus Riflebacteria bacterium]